MAIGDILELTFNQRWAITGEPMMVRLYYAIVDILGNANGLFNAWTAEDGIMELMNATQPDVVQNGSIRVVNLFSLTDFYEADVDGTGIVGGDALPPYCGTHYTLKLDTRGVRNGGICVPGIAEGSQVYGTITGSTPLAVVEALRLAFSEDVIEAGAGVYDPVVVKRVRLEPDEEHPKVRYRLPETTEELNYGHVNSALVNLKVAHRVTRGNGR